MSWKVVDPLDPELRSLISQRLINDEIIMQVVASDDGRLTATLVGKKLYDMSKDPEIPIPIFLAGRELRYRFENGQWMFESIQNWIE